ncbi:CBS-domain-containing membrane protein [Lewinella aquimaris]|uniref:CBS-domain-containing membrane protein n=1 Tax=Neolewinella aquimaris TaxID=1835722 RepID=A0A840DZV7_9BACT|nr:CBS domain-containing protein [Neolewinella aquimaris]MBB4078804.1 CBS-domain-containing membrane protein [Neolewinella aquimaris]
MMNEEVRTIMSTDVVTAYPFQSVGDAAKVMLRNQLQQLPVVDSTGRLLGLITSYDMWRDCRRNRNSENRAVSEVMNVHVVKLAPKDKVGTAAELFMDRRFKTLPVVNLDGKLKGVVTAFDVIRYSLKREYREPILYREVLQ